LHLNLQAVKQSLEGKLHGYLLPAHVVGVARLPSTAINERRHGAGS
jgi:hypothetical protein